MKHAAEFACASEFALVRSCPFDRLPQRIPRLASFSHRRIV